MSNTRFTGGHNLNTKTYTYMRNINILKVADNLNLIRHGKKLSDKFNVNFSTTLRGFHSTD